MENLVVESGECTVVACVHFDGTQDPLSGSVDRVMPDNLAMREG
jgi:hypothetical protein